MVRDFKKKIVAHLFHLIGAKVQMVQVQLEEIAEALESETKSSVGDKHETARAKFHSQQHTLEQQLKEHLRQLHELNRAVVPGDTSLVHNGSLIATNHGWFLLLAPVGRVTVASQNVFVISSLSPIGRLFIGLRRGEGFSMNGQNYLVQEIY